MDINESNYVDHAEEVIKSLIRVDKYGNEKLDLTTSKIRNLMAMSADIYNTVILQNEDALEQDVRSRIDYLRVRFTYESGRDKDVKNFVEKADLINVIKKSNSNKKKYILFYRYMESLVAFHKFYGGKD